MEQADGNCSGRKNKKPRQKPLTQSRVTVDRNSRTYNMNHKKRGRLLVLNHSEFLPETKQDPRSGTYVDIERIKNCFTELGFDVKVCHDFTLEEIKKMIKKVAKEDHSNNDCLAIFVLSHGKNKDVIYAKDTTYDPSVELWGQFTSDKCPSLAGKPKLLFFQVCLGERLDPGHKCVCPAGQLKTVKPEGTEVDGEVYSYRLPACADFLMAYATFEGYYAFRNPDTGSIWIKILCEELEKDYIKMDLLMILTEVQRRMSVEFFSNRPNTDAHDKKQVPHFKSSLIRSLVFGEKSSSC